MKWYTAIGCKMEDDEGRLLVKIGGQEKVLTEMEASCFPRHIPMYLNRQSIKSVSSVLSPYFLSINCVFLVL